MDDTLRKIARAITREMGTKGTTTTTGLQQQGDMLFPPRFFLGVYGVAVEIGAAQAACPIGK
jgi:hypothetical protein